MFKPLTFLPTGETLLEQAEYQKRLVHYNFMTISFKSTIDITYFPINENDGPYLLKTLSFLLLHLSDRLTHPLTTNFRKISLKFLIFLIQIWNLLYIHCFYLIIGDLFLPPPKVRYHQVHFGCSIPWKFEQLIPFLSSLFT